MTQPREWDAATYHRVSAPQHSWGVRVLDRLVLRGDERLLDAGCGTGRVTLDLLEKLRSAGRGGTVCALDRSIEMTRVARRTLPADVPVVAADLLAMPLRQAFDVIFSTATFHWVLDPAALYRGLARVLRPGGRLHAQCGGAGNIGRFFAQVLDVCARPRFAARFTGWKPAWAFLSPEEVTRHLDAAGFIEIRAWLEPEPTTFASRDEFRVFVEKVVLGAWMVRLADAPAEAAAFLDEICDAAGAATPALTLDYVRLNLEARLPGGAS